MIWQTMKKQKFMHASLIRPNKLICGRLLATASLGYPNIAVIPQSACKADGRLGRKMLDETHFGALCPSIK